MQQEKNNSVQSTPVSPSPPISTWGKGWLRAIQHFNLNMNHSSGEKTKQKPTSHNPNLKIQWKPTHLPGAIDVKHGENPGSDKQPTIRPVPEDAKVAYKLRGRNRSSCHWNIITSGWVVGAAPLVVCEGGKNSIELRLLRAQEGRIALWERDFAPGKQKLVWFWFIWFKMAQRGLST